MFEHSKCGFGDGTLGKTTVYDWYKEFINGRDLMGNDQRIDQPTCMRMEILRNIMAVDHRVTYKIKPEKHNRDTM